MRVGICVCCIRSTVRDVYVDWFPFAFRVRYQRRVQSIAKPRKRSSSGSSFRGSVTTNSGSLSAGVAFMARSVFFGDGGSGEIALGVGSYQMIGSSGGWMISPEVDART